MSCARLGCQVPGRTLEAELGGVEFNGHGDREGLMSEKRREVRGIARPEVAATRLRLRFKKSEGRLSVSRESAPQELTIVQFGDIADSAVR